MIELRNIPLHQITESPFNPRRYFSATAMEELTASIKSKGILQPILVRPNADGYEIVAGARRFRAAGEAQLDTIPAVVREMDDTAALEAAVIENLQREDVHPLEEAEGYELLLKQSSYNAEELGAKIGKSRAYIYARLKLLDLCPAARDEFYEGTLDASTALLIARIPGKELQKRAVKEITKQGFNGDRLSYRAAKEHIQHSYMLDLKDANFKPDDASLIPAAGSCTDCPKRTGNDRILFDDVDDLDVCTDPKCFDNKRVEHYLKLKENAEQKGIKIISGETAKKIMPHSLHSIDGFIALDAPCEDDDEYRTYRQILGADAPVSAIIESTSIRDKNSPLIEVAEPTAMAEALARAGFKPNEEPADQKTAHRNAEWAAEQAAKEKATETERAYRSRLFHAVRETTGQRFADQGITIDDLRALAVNIFRAIDYSDAEEVMALHTGPKKFDGDEDFETACDEFATTITGYNVQELGRFLAEAAFIGEVHYMPYMMQEKAHPTRMIAEATRLGIDAEALKNPIPPTPAAQAQEEKPTKKTKAKATPKAAKPTAEKPKAKDKVTPAAPSKVKADLKKPVTKKGGL